MLPVIVGFNPPFAPASGSAFTLTISGTGFAADAQAYWGAGSSTAAVSGTQLATTFVNQGQITATVPAGLLNTKGGVNLILVTGGQISQPAPYGVVGAPNAIDLCTVNDVKGWLASNGVAASNTGDDNNIQRLVTAASFEWLRRTGNAPADGSFPAQSPFVQPVFYDEFYDGTGTTEQFLRHYPIVSVTALFINGTALPPSTGFNVLGYLIGPTGRSLIFRQGGGFGTSPITITQFWIWDGTFSKGDELNRMNVEVQYTAGYAGTPLDVNEAVIEMIGTNYMRRGWIDQASQSMAQGGGTVTYQKWELPPRVRQLMVQYGRTAVV